MTTLVNRPLLSLLSLVSLVSLVSGLATACSPAYSYVPAANDTATIKGQPAADYPIPPEKPQGDVRIASFGFADLSPHGAPSDEPHALHALHMRVVVANNSDKPWTVDTREQRLELAGGGKSAPAFASANAGTPPPLVTVTPAGKRVVDLFFPLPSGQQHASKVPEFDAIWTVHTDARAITERAPFSRVLIQPAPTPYDYGTDYPWGPPYYYDGSFAGFDGVEPMGNSWGDDGPGVYVHGFHDGWRR